MSKKVCFRKEYCPGKIPKGNRRFHCPANTNSKCEIVPKKPRVVRVKAWAVMDRFDRFQAADHYKHGDINIPCTILIDRKYITTRKGEK